MTVEAEPEAPRAEYVLVNKHPLAIRWFHWINFPVIFLMIWSGLLIYWANRVMHIKAFGHDIGPLFPDNWYQPMAPKWVPSWLTIAGTDDAGKPHQYLWNMSYRLAEGMAWHFTIAWLFTINGILYVLYLGFSGAWRQLLPKPSAFKESILVVLHDLYIYRKPLPIRKYNAAQQIAYTGVILMGALMFITGVAIYKPSDQSWLVHIFAGLDRHETAYTVAKFLHFWTTMAFLCFFLVHVGQVVKTGWANFRGMVAGYDLVDREEAINL
jgi:thiosulfate reductase cytochrome b subunit